MAEHIQVGDTTPRIQYTGDGTQTAFTYPFPIFDDGDLEVYVDSTPSVLTTDYTVSGAGVSAGGDVSFLTAPADGTLITLRRNIAIQRTSDFQQSGVLRAQVLNDELDQLTAEIQQVEEQANRGLHLKPFDADTSMELPDKATRMDKVLAFDSSGQPVASTTTLSALENGAVDAEAFADAALASKTAASASADSASISASNAQSYAGAAATAAAANLYSTILNKSLAFSVIATDDGTLFVVDTSGGNVVVTLPDIVTDVAEGFRVGFMKSSSLNTLTINRSGTDTINGGTSYAMTADTEFATMVADDSTPDNWITFGASTTSAGAGLSKSGSTISLDLTNDQTWTGSQRATPTTDNDGSFDMAGANNFSWTPAAADVIEFTGVTAGQGGLIELINPSAYAITKGTNVTADANFETMVSAAGTYLIGYYCGDGTNIRLTYSGAQI